MTRVEKTLVVALVGSFVYSAIENHYLIDSNKAAFDKVSVMVGLLSEQNALLKDQIALLQHR